jgi:hypothetical protein
MNTVFHLELGHNIKPYFWEIDLCGIINSDTFSLAPTIIIDIFQSAVPLYYKVESTYGTEENLKLFYGHNL